MEGDFEAGFCRKTLHWYQIRSFKNQERVIWTILIEKKI